VSLVIARGNPQFALDLVQVVASGAMLPESIETAAMARIDALVRPIARSCGGPVLARRSIGVS
jgi:hypothetical protein